MLFAIVAPNQLFAGQPPFGMPHVNPTIETWGAGDTSKPYVMNEVFVCPYPIWRSGPSNRRLEISSAGFCIWPTTSEQCRRAEAVAATPRPQEPWLARLAQRDKNAKMDRTSSSTQKTGEGFGAVLLAPPAPGPIPGCQRLFGPVSENFWR